MTIETSVTPNRLRVVTDHRPDSKFAVFGMWIGVGTRHEPHGRSGLKHLQEHGHFQGTTTRTPFAIAAAIEQGGGKINASTGYEETGYFTRVLPEYLNSAVDVIGDMLTRATFKAKRIAPEKKVVREEIAECRDAPAELVADLIHTQAYRNQRFGHFILGSPEDISRITCRDLIDSVRRHHCGSNMVAVGVGNISHEKLRAAVDRNFQRLPAGEKPHAGTANFKSSFLHYEKPLEQTHIAIGFQGPTLHDKNLYAAHILSTVLSGGLTGRIMHETRKRGMAYSADAEHADYSDTGIFVIQAGINPGRVREFISVVGKHVCGLQEKIGSKEFERGRNQRLAALMESHGDIADWAHSLASHTLTYGRPFSCDEIEAGYRAITKEMVRETAAETFSRAPVAIALGPQDDVPQYAELLEELRIKRPRQIVREPAPSAYIERPVF